MFRSVHDKLMLFCLSFGQFKPSTVHISKTPHYITRIRINNRECLEKAKRLREEKAMLRRAAMQSRKAANSVTVQNNYVSVGDYSKSNNPNLSNSPVLKHRRLTRSSANRRVTSSRSTVKQLDVVKTKNHMRSTALCVPCVSSTSVPTTSLNRLIASNKRLSTIPSHGVASTGSPSKMRSARKKLLCRRSVPLKAPRSCQRLSEAVPSKKRLSARMRLLSPSRDVIRSASGRHLSSVNHPLVKATNTASLVIGQPFSFSFERVKSKQSGSP